MKFLKTLLIPFPNILHLLRIALSLLLISIIVSTSYSQELDCKITVNADQIATQDRRVFTDMETAFAQFVNSRRWTNDTYQPEERIKCNFNLTINSMPSIGSFEATVQILSARPIYNSNYESIMLNFADRDWSFDYVESQPLDFNPNSFQNNLTSLLAYYAYIILAMDYDSFAELSGTPYYQLAQNVVTNATPSGRPGWTSLESNRNRFWFIENLTNQQMLNLRKGFYTYHRQGLDIFQDNQDEAQKNIVQVLENIRDIRELNPNSIVIISFLDSKADELVNIFSEGNPQLRRQAYNILIEIDPRRRDKYNRIISN